MKNKSDENASVNGDGDTTKITHRAENAKLSPTGHDELSPTGRGPKSKKSPTYIYHVEIEGGVEGLSLTQLLNENGQLEWSTDVRCKGALLFLDWVCRKYGAKPFRASGALAENYASVFKHPKFVATKRELLPMLAHIGVLIQTAPAAEGYVMLSAEYQLAPAYAAKIHKFTVGLTPKLLSKIKMAEERKERRLGHTHKFRAQLLIDLAKVGLSPVARKILADMHRSTKDTGLQGIIANIDGGRHIVRVDRCGTIGTTISSLRRELKPHLTIAGEPAISCDISHTHHCFLPRLLSNRIEHLAKTDPGRDLSGMQDEHQRFVDVLSGPDYYRHWCKDPSDDAERTAKKGLINSLLNMTNEKCRANGFYQRMRRTFPITWSVVEDIKRKDHRNISKPLQRFTSDAINGALLQLQREDIAAIPQADAIICKTSDQERVRKVIGEHVFKESTGVTCKVNGVSTGTPPIQRRRMPRA